MREVTHQLIKDFKIYQKGFDFMAYKIDKKSQISFHHIIVPHRDCKKRNIPCDGYVYWNGVILDQLTSHNYLHLIENIDQDRFFAITSEMIDEKVKGFLDIKNLKYIRDILVSFEREHSNKIKEEYVSRRIKLP